MIADNHLSTLRDRLDNPRLPKIEVTQRETFAELLSTSGVPAAAKALSVSVGDGVWDYLAFDSLPQLSTIVATDIVENPVAESARDLLRSKGDWSFVQVEPDRPLPFPDASFDLVFHHDVVEHTSRPLLFLSEQYRVLRPGGHLIFGTPNLFRPANIMRLMTGRLRFPVTIGRNVEIGDYVHVQEFHEAQLQLLLEETGFRTVELWFDYFGLSFTNLCFAAHPSSRLGRSLCHYLQARCVK